MSSIKKQLYSFISALLAASITLTPCWALPTGWEVLSGQVDIQQNGNVLNVISQSQNAVIQYITFNLASGETINFILPNSSASILNQVLGSNISNIAGTINSNGIIGLSNTAGIQIANSAQIQAASLLLSGLNVSGFNSNIITLNKDPNSNNGSVINSGAIDIASGGYAVIAGGGVVNAGTIIAEDGSIHLAVGDSMTVHLSDNTVVNVTIDEGIKQLIDEMNVAVGNKGALMAHQVELKAKLDENMLANTVNNDGIIVATGLHNVGGKIVMEAEGGQNFVSNTGLLYAGETNNNNVAGTIHIKGAMAYNSGDIVATGGTGEKGGHVDMLGDIVMNEGGFIDVSGDIGGGTALIGGDFQGTGNTYKAKINITDESTLVLADAKTTGDGGKVIFWSDGDTFFNGNVYARGGEESGNGGFTEVSGHEYLDYQGNVDLTAANGEKGELLLDPTNLLITDFSPNDISNLVNWYDSNNFTNNVIYDGSNRVSQWNDLAGTNNLVQGTNNNKPLYVTNALNGSDVIRFDGSNDFLTQVSNIGISGGTARSVLVNFRQTSAANKYLYSWGAGTTLRAYEGFIYGGETATNFYGPVEDSLFGAGPNYTANTWANYSSVYSAGTFSDWLNGTAGVPVNFTMNTTNTQMSLGQGIIGSFDYFNGDMSEVLIYNKALTATERAQLAAHNAKKWGTANQSVLERDRITTMSATANVNLLASNDITFEDMAGDAIKLTGAGRSLTLTAGRNIIMNDAKDTISTNGGTITMTASAGDMKLGILDTGSGADINLYAGGNIKATQLIGKKLTVKAGGDVGDSGSYIDTILNDMTIITGGGGAWFSEKDSITIDSSDIAKDFLIKTGSGAALAMNNSSVGGDSYLSIGGGNGDITGTGNTFIGNATFETNDNTGGDITMSADFQRRTFFSGDRLRVTDTAGDLNVSAFSTGSNSSASTITVNSGGLDISGINLDSVSATAAGRLDASARKDINIDGTGWNPSNDILNAWSTSGGSFNISNLTSTTTAPLTATVGSSNPNSAAAGYYLRTSGGSYSILNSRIDGAVNITSSNAAITLGSVGNAVDFNSTTNFSAGTGDVTGYGAYQGNVTGTGGRIGFYTSSGNFTSGGLTASGATGWNGASDESLIVQTVNGDILGSGYTTSSAANIRLQAGSTSSVLATNNINVSNVSTSQNLGLWATGDSSGSGSGSAITVNSGNVGGYIQAAGFNASNYLTGTNGSIDLTLSSGNLTTGLAWSASKNINLTTSNGSILQTSAGYPWTFNGKTIFTNGGDVTLTANGGANSYISTGVNAIGAGSDLTAKASGSSTGTSTGTSIQLYGYVGGNLSATNTSLGNTTGRVYLGSNLGVVSDLNDTYTVEDVIGTTTVKAAGDVYLYGSFKGAINVTGRSVTAAADKGNLTFSQATTSVTSGTGINATSYRGSILGSNLTTLGSAKTILNAGTLWDRDKFSVVNLTGVNTGGSLTIKVAGSSTGTQAGNSVSITGSTGGSTTVTDELGGSTLGTVTTP